MRVSLELEEISSLRNPSRNSSAVNGADEKGVTRDLEIKMRAAESILSAAALMRQVLKPR